MVLARDHRYHLRRFEAHGSRFAELIDLDLPRTGRRPPLAYSPTILGLGWTMTAIISSDFTHPTRWVAVSEAPRSSASESIAKTAILQATPAPSCVSSSNLAARSQPVSPAQRCSSIDASSRPPSPPRVPSPRAWPPTPRECRSFHRCRARPPRAAVDRQSEAKEVISSFTVKRSSPSSCP